jgi:MtrB/PioB family decaheme-associated outer membrane protein
MEKRSLLLTLAVAAALGSSATAVAAPPDTAEWTCSKCPFDRGYRSEAELGGAYVDDDSAKFGDYTGLDEKGGYVVASAEGRSAAESGYVLEYELSDLGLESREARLTGGLQGRYDFELFYDRIPHSIWDTTETPFRGNGSTRLTLPAGWVDGGSTAGMSALDASLRPVDVGYDRDRYGAAGGYWFSDALRFSLDYRRDDRSGTRPQLASFGSVSAEMLRPVDDATDRVDATLRYQGAGWFAEAGYSGSIYDTQAAWLTFDNPFTAMAPGGDVGRLALPPDNQYHEFGVTGGWFGLPWNSTLALSFATGKGTQDIGFLPYTINPLIATGPLPARNLDGEVTVTRAELTLSSRPIDRLRLRGMAAWDERDNGTRRYGWDSIVHTDLFPVLGERENPAYGFERLRLQGSADFAVYDDLSIGVGGEYREVDRKGAPRQEVRSESQIDGWGVAQYRPTGYLGIVLKGGAKEREPDDGYDLTVAAANGQNPRLRKYNMAYLYRSYGEMLVDVAVGTLPLTLGASAFYGDDSYNFSTLGIGSGLDRRWGVDLTWAVNDKVSAWLSGGQERIDVRSQGSSVFAEPDWRAIVEDDFTTYGGGFRWQFADDVRLEATYTHAEGESDTVLRGVSAGAFPTVESDWDSLRADFLYGLTDRLDLVLAWQHERYSSDDWAIAGIGPATLPTVLSLGAEPYDYNVNFVSVSVRYYFGSRGLSLPE